MSIEMPDFDSNIREAVRAFWHSREAARRKQVESGKADQGERASVTSGKNMDGFLNIVRQLVVANGLLDAQVQTSRKLLTLPGYFRPSKEWDVVVIHEKRLIAALEFKSQVGPSFGNNFNNRAEEAIGSAHDLWVAYREGAFGESPLPFVGWMIMLEDCEKSQQPIKDNCLNFPMFPEFQGASYSERYNLLCKRLVKEQLYSAAALLLSPRAGVITGEYSDLSEMTSVRSFFAGFAARVAAEAVRK
ncbi:MAG TPA: PaeR7I family type II restriction endonuclease [Geobacteraceae bacterium]|nr:PaeR7I family type II restriction endonuclease [Geobacteraceae bacterium]